MIYQPHFRMNFGLMVGIGIGGVQSPKKGSEVIRQALETDFRKMEFSGSKLDLDLHKFRLKFVSEELFRSRHHEGKTL